MKIYLDTWVIQNWFTGNLLDDEKRFLDNFIYSGEHEVVLSQVHLWEISARSDKAQAIKIGNMLDKISRKLWVKNSNELKISAMKYAP
jgi:PIN domain nuclease of toxin-antitoxin system